MYRAWDSLAHARTIDHFTVVSQSVITLSLRSMAVLSSRAQERESREIRAPSARTSGEAARKIKLLPPQSPRGFSALARLYYLARPTKTAMLRRLYYPYYPVHTNAFSKVCVFVIIENASIISRPHHSLEAFSTVQTNMMCMRFRFDPLSRAF